MKTSGETEPTANTSENNDPLTLEALEKAFDAIFEGLPQEGVLTDDEYAAYQKAGFVSITRGRKWIIYVDPERLK